MLPVAAQDAAAASGGVRDFGAAAPDAVAEPGVAVQGVVAVPDAAAEPVAVAEPAGLPAAADVAAPGQEDVGPGDWPVLGEPADRETGPGLTGGPAWIVLQGLTWVAPRDQAAPGVAQPAVMDGSQVGPVCREHCRDGWRLLLQDGCLQA